MTINYEFLPLQSQVQNLETAVLRSGLAPSEKEAILSKLALGSLVGLNNVAQTIMSDRTHSLFRLT